MNLSELTDMLNDKMEFEFDKNKKIGHIRCQFGDDKQIANQFVPSSDMSDKVKEYDLNLKRINEVCDTLQFDLIKNYDGLLSYCNGDDFNKKETDYFMQDENVNYWIRLMPIGINEYNVYIHIYHN